MDDKIVSFAKHGFFYKMFYDNEFESLISITELKFINLNKGYKRLLTFYSSYSHYLLNAEDDLRKQILDEITQLKENIRYKELVKKIRVDNLNYLELIDKNNIYYNTVKNIFEYFEIFFKELAFDDIMPALTSNVGDYEKSVLFACYEKFYLHLFNLHAKIGESLTNFNIINFMDSFKLLMAFYYGFSFYMNQKTKNQILELFLETWNKYNNIDNMKLIEKMLRKTANKKDLEQLKHNEEDVFISVNYIFDLINRDLPKKNLMPKKKEKIIGDRWGI